jgi:hypothetical protein
MTIREDLRSLANWIFYPLLLVGSLCALKWAMPALTAASALMIRCPLIATSDV